MMRIDQQQQSSRRAQRIPARVPATVSATANLRFAARSMVESGVFAVLVENSIGPMGFVTARDVVRAIAGGADPDLLWTGEISGAAPLVVSCNRHPVNLGKEMVADRLEMVAVMDEGTHVGMSSALDVLGALLDWVGDARDPTW